MRQWDRARAWGSREECLGEQREVRRSMERPEEVGAQWSSNPALCSCLENPRDGGAEWAATYGVAQSRTQLKRLSSSSSSVLLKCIY